MKKKVAFIFPGQGAQYSGMGKDFYDQFPVAKAVFDEADAFLGTRFSELIFAGEQSELTLTKNSQVAIYIVSIAVLRTVQEMCPSLEPVICAGLSLGEYTALVAAGKLSFVDGLALVRVRAEAMHLACEETKGTMHVVLGMTEEVIESVIGDIKPDAWIANLNCPGQVVIAGSVEGIEHLAKALKEKGAKRVLPLDVSGAFHTPLMNSAREKLAAKIATTQFLDSNVDIVMNVPGDLISSMDAMKAFLVEQVTSPVRWEKGIHRTVESGIEFYLEMGPGKTLAGMNKRIGVTAPTVSIDKAQDLEELNKMVENYAIIES